MARVATVEATCYRCNGTKVYRWGSTVNGVSRFSGPCFRCVGGGEFPPVDPTWTVPENSGSIKRLDLTCPKCKRAGALTRAEAAKHYQCRDCADVEEGAF